MLALTQRAYYFGHSNISHQHIICNTTGGPPVFGNLKEILASTLILVEFYGNSKKICVTRIRVTEGPPVLGRLSKLNCCPDFPVVIFPYNFSILLKPFQHLFPPYISSDIYYFKLFSSSYRISSNFDETVLRNL